MSRAVPLALIIAAVLTVAGCFGPREGVLIVSDGTGGRVAVSEREGGVVTLQATPDEGYAFAGWRCVSGLMCPEGAEQISGPRATVEAGAELALGGVFERMPATAALTLEDAEGGTAAADCGQQCARERGWQVSVEAVPDAGRHFRGWECEGGAACAAFNLTSPSIGGPVNGDITLTPRYSAADGSPLTLPDGVGGVLTALANCGTACAAGEGWSTVLSAAQIPERVARSWNCAEEGPCPLALADSGATARFTVEEPVAVDLELSEFVIHTDKLDKPLPRFLSAPLCSVDEDCVHLASGETLQLTVDAPDGIQLEYTWNVLQGGAQLSLTQPQPERAALTAASDLGGIIEGTVEVVARDEDGAVAARDTLNVAALPAALSVQIESSGFLSCIGSFGSVISDGAEHYVVTRFEDSSCYNGFIDASPYDVTIGGKRPVEGEAWGVDSITGLAVLRIPDPELEWLPSIAAAGHSPDEPAWLVGQASHQEISSITSTLSAAVFEVMLQPANDCEGYLFESFAAGPFPETCDYEYWDLAEVPVVGLRGAPVFNSNWELVGFLFEEVLDLQMVRTGRILAIDDLDVLQPLLQGGRRCTVFGPQMLPGTDIIQLAQIGVEECSAQGN